MSEPWQVGKYYRVPCVRAFVNMVTDWYVVLGPWHEDAEHIGFKDHHWHLDLRFAPKRIMQHRENHPSGIAITELMTDFVGDGKLHWKRRKMLRQMPMFPCTRAFARYYQPGRRVFPDLVHAYASSGITPGGHCPHKGFDLSSTPAIQCGDQSVIVCPLHGLCFDEQTGEAIDPLAVEHKLMAAHGVPASPLTK
jgi:hypothetical protein